MTIDGIPLGLFNGLSIVAVVLLGFWMFATGRLYTRSQVVEERAAREREMARMVAAHERELSDANHERGEWRIEARLKDQTITEQAGQITAMQDGFGVLKDFLVALRRAGLRVSQEEDS